METIRLYSLEMTPVPENSGAMQVKTGGRENNMTHSHKRGYVQWQKWRVSAMPTPNPAHALKAISFPSCERVSVHFPLHSGNPTIFVLKLNQNIMAIEINDANFDEIVMKSDKPVLIDFWAVWCGPCRMVGPIVEELSKEYEGKAIVGKVDVDSNPKISMNLGIRNIPTLLFFKNGQVVDKQVGAVPKSVLANKLNAQLS